MKLAARLALAAGLLSGPAFADSIPEPSAYRLENFRAPTPQTLAGATVLSTADAVEISAAKSAVFIDVMPQPPRPANLPAGTLWRDPPHDTIPGAIWLPNVGFGALAPETEAFFKAGLAKATNGDPTRAVVIFCMRDCWMSWNAAKRALSYGYTAVLWFPDGTDGWTDSGRALVRAERER